MKLHIHYKNFVCKCDNLLLIYPLYSCGCAFMCALEMDGGECVCVCEWGGMGGERVLN